VVHHRDLIVTLAARHKLPAIYWDRFFVATGGYGPDLVDQCRSAASYVDRILKVYRCPLDGRFRANRTLSRHRRMSESDTVAAFVAIARSGHS
jgi:hypothetical protein